MITNSYTYRNSYSHTPSHKLILTITYSLTHIIILIYSHLHTHTHIFITTYLYSHYHILAKFHLALIFTNVICFGLAPINTFLFVFIWFGLADQLSNIILLGLVPKLRIYFASFGLASLKITNCNFLGWPLTKLVFGMHQMNITTYYPKCLMILNIQLFKMCLGHGHQVFISVLTNWPQLRTKQLNSLLFIDWTEYGTN